MNLPSTTNCQLYFLGIRETIEWRLLLIFNPGKKIKREVRFRMNNKINRLSNRHLCGLENARACRLHLDVIVVSIPHSGSLITFT